MTVVNTNSIGRPLSRVDGPAKVKGEAKYAAEFNVPNLAHGFVVSSAVAKGRIKSIDRTAALAVPGVIEVFAHDNRPTVASSHKKYNDEAASPGSPFRPLYDETVLYAGQPIALVVAEELEIAQFAATLVVIEYEVEEAVTDLDTQIDKAYVPRKSDIPDGIQTLGAMSTRVCRARQSTSNANTAPRSSTTIRWNALERRPCGKAMDA